MSLHIEIKIAKEALTARFYISGEEEKNQYQKKHRSQ